MATRSYFQTYTKRPAPGSEAQVLATLTYRDRWRLLEGASRVLDIGFGSGGFADAAPAGTEVVGLDADPAAVDARPDIGHLGSAEELPFESGSFDAVHAAHVIEHLDAPRRMVDECARVLRPGGRILIATPDIERTGFRFWVDHTHVTPFTRESLSRLLFMSGFDVLDIHHGLSPQTRAEEALGRLGMSLEQRYALRRRLGQRLGREIVALARLA